jgi:hypothetical protein
MKRSKKIRKKCNFDEIMIKNIVEELDILGINYNLEFCDKEHTFVIHCWLEEDFKCNLFAITRRWVPFGFSKGISGFGLLSLYDFLLNKEIPPLWKQTTYQEKIEELVNCLISVRDERNFDIIDGTLKDFT